MLLHTLIWPCVFTRPTPIAHLPMRAGLVPKRDYDGAFREQGPTGSRKAEVDGRLRRTAVAVVRIHPQCR